MAKINYSKAERELHEALQRMRVQNLAEGKSVTSKRAEEFYGLGDESPRPVPEESVSKLLREEAATEEATEKKRQETLARRQAAEAAGEPLPPEEPPLEEEIEEFDEEAFFSQVRGGASYDVIKASKPQSQRLPKPSAPPPSKVPPSDVYFEPTAPLYILRQHILWLKRKHCDNRYELLGTTREEVSAFRTARRLTDKQIMRIKEINVHADEVKAAIMAQLGMKTEEKLIEKQKQKHKTKRFNVKETWLPL
jgi:hypothetical protein